jgi:hypothetical protein
MEDKKSQSEQDNQMKEFLEKICQMRTLALMVENAPKDNNGNVIVSIVGIKDIGVFYQFAN